MGCGGQGPAAARRAGAPAVGPGAAYIDVEGPPAGVARPVGERRVADGGDAVTLAPAIDAAPWLRALESVVLTPPRFRERTLTRQEALSWLACPSHVFDALAASGLPDAGPGPRYDFHDVVN